jgi:hypothetical protein
LCPSPTSVIDATLEPEARLRRFDAVDIAENRMERPWRAAALAIAALVVAACGSSGPAVRVVTHANVTYPHYSTIQSAVDAAAPGDWILIDVGVYNESVRITKPRLHVRGMDRNMVVVDGQNRVGNGIEVLKADGVSIDNLTLHDFDRATVDGDDGNPMQSTNNCATGNTTTRTVPANLETMWGCGNATTPNLGAGALTFVLSLQDASKARTSVPQPAPPPQPTMPNPCSGVPSNPLCTASGH